MNAARAREALGPLVPPDQIEALADHLSRLPDPEGAVRTLERLAAHGAALRDPIRLHAALTLGGCSAWLGGLLIERPDILEAIPTAGPARALPAREDLEEDLARFQFRAGIADPSAVLRRFKEREYVRIALADLLRAADLGAITSSLALLADVLIDRALHAALAALEARHGRPTFRNDRGEVEESTFAVIGLGKLGGGELNYSSDIDILYLFARDGETTGTGAAAEGAISNREFFLRLAAAVTRIIGGREQGGEVFRVDLDLRPGGRDGDLALSLGAAVAYYRNWAEGWERQALIKARAVAGDPDLGRRFVAAVEPLVYPLNADPYLAIEIAAMKDRIDARLSRQGTTERDVKLGRGGIRELEFAVQALQLRRGGADPWLRQGNTLLALHRLAERGVIAYAEYASLADAYVVLRDIEHRLQLGHNRQTALLPAGDDAWKALARTMAPAAPPSPDEPRRFAATLEKHRDAVRAFYDQVIGGASQLAIADDTADVLLDRLDDAALVERLRGAGLPDAGTLLKPVHALRRLLQPAALSPDLAHALRRAGPLLMRAALESARPRRALANLETLFSTLLAEPDGLRRFLERRDLLAPAVRLLGRSDLLAGLLIRQTAILRDLEDRARVVHTPSASRYREPLLGAARAAGDALDRAAMLRRRHQQALATIALRDISRQATVREVVKSLSLLADATLDAALVLARDEVRLMGGDGDGPRLAILGLGRLGYRELDYGSDLDLVFLHDPRAGDPAADRAAASRVCEAVVRLLSSLSREGQLYRVDLRLRPSGSKGELVASPGALRAYFQGDADVWEMLSFLKARAVAGDRALGGRAVADVETTLLERAARMPERELVASARDMRRRLLEAGGGVAGARRPKHGAGGLADIDFAAEYLQLRHGVRGPDDKDTLRLLTLLRERGILGESEMSAFYEGYLFLRGVDHEMRLMHGGPVDALPDDASRLAEIAQCLPETAGSPPAPPHARDRAAAFLAEYDGRAAAVRAAYDAVLPEEV